MTPSPEDLVARLRDVADSWHRELPQSALATLREAADLITALTAPAAGLVLETTAKERDEWLCTAEGAHLRFDDVHRLLNDHATLTARLAAADERIADLNTLAHGWMDAHDKLKAGKPYSFPSPVDLPDALARLAAAEAAKDEDGAEIIKLWREREEARSGMEREARGHLKARTAREATEAALREANDLLLRVIDQADNDLKSAHAEIIKLQGKSPEDYDWPEWSPQANSIRWHAELRAALTNPPPAPKEDTVK